MISERQKEDFFRLVKLYAYSGVMNMFLVDICKKNS